MKTLLMKTCFVHIFVTNRCWTLLLTLRLRTLSIVSVPRYKCPICRTGTEKDLAVVDVRIILNQLARLKVKCKVELQCCDFETHKPKCPYPFPYGCGVSISRAQESEHERVCTHVKVPCSAAHVGCTKIVRRGKLSEYLTNCQWAQSHCIIEPLYVEIDLLSKNVDILTQKVTQQENERSNR